MWGGDSELNAKSLNRLSAWLVSLIKVGSEELIGASMLSRYAEMFSLGQLQAEIMGRPGLLGLCTVLYVYIVCNKIELFYSLVL